MKKDVRASLSAFLLALMIALPALAYDYPLSSKAIREAYFQGKEQSDKRAAFFEKYTQHLPMPKTGPHVSMIQFQTPYAVIVQHASEMLSYSAPDAVEEFLDKPAVCRLRVQIDVTDTFSQENGGVARHPAAHWRNYTFRLFQDQAQDNDKELRPRSARGWPLHSFGKYPVLAGWNVELEYDAASIEAEPVKVEVLTPDGQQIDVTFDLGALR